MELIDVLDERGSPTGEVKPREEVHRLGLWHRASHVWILNSKKELLIQKRANVRLYCPNAWSCSIAGHIKAGETALATAVKEVHEELGLRCQEEEFEHLFVARKEHQYQPGIYVENELNEVYLVRRDVDADELSLQPEEVAEAKFIPWRELERMMRNGAIEMLPNGDEYEKLFAHLHERFG